MKCISCKSDHEFAYCPFCGEKAGVKKITFSSIAADSFSSFTAMDKGFLFNFKMLIIKPKTLVNDYLGGKRKGIFNPVSFLILSVSLYLILEGLLEPPKITRQGPKLPEAYLGQVAVTGGYYLHQYFKYFWVIAILLLSFSTRLLFGKYNFTEHLAINAFILGQATIIGLLSYLFIRIGLVFNPLVYLVIFALNFSIFLSNKEYFEGFFKSLLVLVFFILQLLAIALGLGVIFV